MPFPVVESFLSSLLSKVHAQGTSTVFCLALGELYSNMLI
jgi:hypothetical protein